MNATEQTSTHTPGPWEITGFADCQLITKDVPPAIGQPIAIGKVYGDAQIANARLIAVAPDMLSVLLAFVDDDGRTTTEMLQERARAVITKASAAA